MRIVIFILLLLLMISIASASLTTGTVSLEVINPNHGNNTSVNTSITNSTELSDFSRINQNSLELRYIEQEKQKEKSNLITGHAISNNISSEDNLKGLLWFLGIICFILLLYLIRKLLKMKLLN